MPRAAVPRLRPAAASLTRPAAHARATRRDDLGLRVEPPRAPTRWRKRSAAWSVTATRTLAHGSAEQQVLEPDDRRLGRATRPRRTASSTPGMNDSRSIESWRIVSVWPTSPRMTSWWATRPGRRTEWIGTSPSISSAVRAAVPLGASSLRSWCSSTISALAMCRDASAAKRIISTAPIAKFGREEDVRAGRAELRSALDVPAGRPDDGVDAGRDGTRSALSSAGVGLREVDEDVGVAEHVGERRCRARGRRGRSAPGRRRPRPRAQTVCPIRPAAPATATRISSRAHARPRAELAPAARARAGTRPRRRRSPAALRRSGANSSRASVDDVVERDGVDALDDLVDASAAAARRAPRRRGGSSAPPSTRAPARCGP